MAVRLGLLLSLLEGLVGTAWGVWALILSTEWRLVTLIFLFFEVVALAWIWLGVFVVRVVVKAVRVLNEGGQP